MKPPRALPLTTGTAFAVLVALIFAQALNSLFQLHTLGEEVRTMTEKHNRKIDIITQTEVDAHIRTESLIYIMLAADVF